MAESIEYEAVIDAWLERLEQMLDLMMRNGRMEIDLLRHITVRLDVLEARVAKIENMPQSIPEYLPRG